MYALPIKKSQTEESDEKKDPPAEASLPPGWEKHEGNKNTTWWILIRHYGFSLIFCGILDNDGPYFWHIKSGTITREPPTASTEVPALTPIRIEKRYNDDLVSFII